MSLMTESLLLEAQSLRLEGDIDTSIDLLKTVVSQCNSDLASQQNHTTDGNGDRSTTNADTVHNTRQLRQVAAYQLALLLLQRSGRMRVGEVDTGKGDENEADELLWQLGYRLRLSKMAFGYPLCCSCRQKVNTEPSREESSIRPPLTTIDNLLPPSIFQALQHAFRPDSRYWSEFYCKVNNETSQQVDGVGDDISQKPKANQFASHNIPLPSYDASSGSKSLLHHFQHSTKSMLEQIAIFAQHQLKEHFPDLTKATSVEIWSHRRPPDGQHQLHYDLDEILLYQQRKKLEQEQNDEGSSEHARGTKRQKTGNEGGKNACRDSVSCPIVSCVLTINVPSQSGSCSICGDRGNSAPTLICNQSISHRNGNKSTIGWLCYPHPNRILAFEGSLLHGVVPGIPFAQSSNSSDDDGSSSCDDFYDVDFSDAKRKPDKGQRITLMMGFWKDVCLTTPDENSKGSPMGPNVPFDRLLKSTNAWAEEFKPIVISEKDIGHISTTNTIIDDIDPLWVPVQNKSMEGEKAFGEYAPSEEAKQFSGRFFLKSLEPTDIDHNVLSGS